MNQAITILVIAAVVFGGWLWFANQRAANVTLPEPAASSSATAAATSTASSSPAAAAPKRDTGGSNPGLSYGEAVATFASRRIQFDANCVATPAYVVFKNGTNVMFDNRSPNGRYFALDGTRYYLRGYDFRILTLRSARLPHTVAVDCGSGRNNAQIVLN